MWPAKNTNGVSYTLGSYVKVDDGDSTHPPHPFRQPAIELHAPGFVRSVYPAPRQNFKQEHCGGRRPQKLLHQKLEVRKEARHTWPLHCMPSELKGEKATYHHLAANVAGVLSITEVVTSHLDNHKVHEPKVQLSYLCQQRYSSGTSDAECACLHIRRESQPVRGQELQLAVSDQNTQHRQTFR